MKITEPSAMCAFLAIVAYQHESKEFEVSVPDSQMRVFVDIMNRNKLIRTYTCNQGIYNVRLK